eukprot:TRINITY_DN30001_c0_g1_i1.p1 TRINITY_DN30001_c0_g1~~TRINITY_DN30001_c0_g1_i1.p1  ORF type:complete len:109 (-),score=29.39 TRINITY_DN30001_c0_g1_i1:132-458(-)
MNLQNQKFVLQKINGWKIYHLSASMEDIVDMESELSKRLQEVGRRLEEAANKDVSKELVKVQELIKANIQRSKVIQDQVSEAKEILKASLSTNRRSRILLSSTRAKEV